MRRALSLAWCMVLTEDGLVEYALTLHLERDNVTLSSLLHVVLNWNEIQHIYSVFSLFFGT
jgi:hypothetical protein